MMKNILCLLFILSFGWNATAQRVLTGEEIIRGGLVKCSGNIGPGFLVKPTPSTSALTALYVSGDLEVYLSRRVSIRGDLSFYVGAQQRVKVLAHNHSMFFGLSYHMPFKKADFFLGLQPGATIAQGYQDDGESLSTVRVLPVISALGGCQLYFSRFFHFYVATRFVAGTYFGEASSPVNLTEFRILAGMGFNINMVKMKKKTVEMN